MKRSEAVFPDESMEFGAFVRLQSRCAAGDTARESFQGSVVEVQRVVRKFALLEFLGWELVVGIFV